jgi:hypothetical protein
LQDAINVEILGFEEAFKKLQAQRDEIPQSV